MRPTRSTLRRAAAVAVAGTLVTGSLLGAPAQAAPTALSPDAAATLTLNDADVPADPADIVED